MELQKFYENSYYFCLQVLVRLHDDNYEYLNTQYELDYSPSFG